MTQPNHQTTGYNQNKPVDEMTDPAEKLMLVSKVSYRIYYQRKSDNKGKGYVGSEVNRSTSGVA